VNTFINKHQEQVEGEDTRLGLGQKTRGQLEAPKQEV
jgi:hypothetical protein